MVSGGDLLKICLRPDADIAEKVRGELVARLIPAGSSALDVRVQDGAVTLTGTVPNSSLIDRLVRLARAVPGRGRGRAAGCRATSALKPVGTRREIHDSGW
ncbi:BON domain-containing protein [Streptomyces sp. NBC_01794]|uniref:BON domain-containing protein n=1 Tax=unclassified Streptomyces TaxID=2593676 RepID=UPI0038734D9E